jgi:hypothetical protein
MDFERWNWTDMSELPCVSDEQRRSVNIWGADKDELRVMQSETRPGFQQVRDSLSQANPAHKQGSKRPWLSLHDRRECCRIDAVRNADYLLPWYAIVEKALLNKEGWHEHKVGKLALLSDAAQHLGRWALSTLFFDCSD